MVVTATNAAGSGERRPRPRPPSSPAPPVNTGLPAISGSTFVGQTLTASNGSWTGNPTGYSRRWQRCDSAGASCVDIAFATGSTYLLGAADAGTTLRVAVTATNAAGPRTATSNQTAVIAGAPVNTSLPTINGSAAVGQTLTAADGTWSGNPTGYSRQWQRCDTAGANCTDIGGATGSTYTLAAADAGTTLRVVVTATNAAGSAAATSNQTAVIAGAPVNTSLPTINGSAAVGQTLTAAERQLERQPDRLQPPVAALRHRRRQLHRHRRRDRLRPPARSRRRRHHPTHRRHRHQRGRLRDRDLEPDRRRHRPTRQHRPARRHRQRRRRADADGRHGRVDEQPDRASAASGNAATAPAPTAPTSAVATGSTYVLGAADAGTTLRIVVTATNAAGTSTATSNQTAGRRRPARQHRACPTITGSTVVGQTLTADTGVWTNSPTELQPPVAALRRHRRQLHRHRQRHRHHLPARRRRRRHHPAHRRHRHERGRKQHRDLDPDPVVTGPPVNTGLPAVTGSAFVGQTLTADTGVWTNSPTGFSRQWQRCDTTGANCTDINAATGTTTYSPPPTPAPPCASPSPPRTRPGPAPRPRTRPRSSPARPSTPACPPITGSAVVGQTLTADTGVWTNSPTGFSRQWQRCDSTGADCTDIGAATASTYVLAAADAGSTLRVIVTATNAAGSTSASSAPTSLIQSNVPLSLDGRCPALPPPAAAAASSLSPARTRSPRQRRSPP